MNTSNLSSTSQVSHNIISAENSEVVDLDFNELDVSKELPLLDFIKSRGPDSLPLVFYQSSVTPSVLRSAKFLKYSANAVTFRPVGKLE